MHTVQQISSSNFRNSQPFHNDTDRIISIHCIPVAFGMLLIRPSHFEPPPHLKVGGFISHSLAVLLDLDKKKEAWGPKQFGKITFLDPGLERTVSSMECYGWKVPDINTTKPASKLQGVTWIFISNSDVNQYKSIICQIFWRLRNGCFQK